MENFSYEMVLVTNPTYSVISEDEPFKTDDIRNEDLYAYMANLDNFLYTREENFSTIPLNRLDRSGDRISVLMGGSAGLRWQKISRKVTGVDRAAVGFDESFKYQGPTLITGNFNWIDGVSITLNSIIPGVTGGRATTKLLQQQTGENAWQYVTPTVTFTGTAFTKLNEVLNADNTSNLTVYNKKDDLNIVGQKILGSNGKLVNVLSEVSKEPLVKTGSVIKGVAATRTSISVILEDGSVYNWGQIETTDIRPPVAVKNFKQVASDYYAFAGLTEDGKIYAWGYGGYTSSKIIEFCPTASGFRHIAVGYDYGLAIDANYNLIHWGSTARVDPALLPSRYTTKTAGMTDRSADDFIKVAAGYQIGMALRRDGRIEAFAVKDYSNLIANKPTTSDFIDVDVNYQTALALKADGTVVQWGVTSYALPSFRGETITKVIAGRYIFQAISSLGNLFTWGTSTLTNITGTYRTGVVDTDSYDYIGAYVKSDYSIVAFTKVATGSPYDQVKNNAPATKAKQGGTYTEGYTIVYKLSESLSADVFYPVTSRTAYHTYTTDIRDETQFTPLVYDTVTLISDATIEIKFKRTSINTSRITFLYGVKTPYEIATNIQFDMDSLRIGE
jgi:hypothetical protein